MLWFWRRIWNWWLQNFEASLQKFEETLFPRVGDEDQKVHNRICYVILYALRFDKDGSKNKCDKTEFQTKNLIVILLKIFLINLNLLSIYKNLKICVMKSIAFYQNTDIFFEFLELKNKYHRLTVKNKNEQKIVRQLSSCLIEKYSGFTQITHE